MAEFKLITGESVIVDEKIYNDFKHYNWRLSYDGHVCAYVVEKDYQLRKIVLGCGVGDKIRIEYRNCNSLDCRIDNLIIKGN